MSRRFSMLFLLLGALLLAGCHPKQTEKVAVKLTPVEKAWRLSTNGDYSACVSYIDSETAQLGTVAISQERRLGLFPTTKDALSCRELDQVGSLLWVKQQCLREQNRIAGAMPVWEELFHDYPHCTSDPALGQRSHPALDARMEWQKYRLLLAARSGQLESYTLPMDNLFDTPVFTWFLNAVGSELLEHGEYDRLEAACQIFTSGKRWQNVWLSSAADALLDGAASAADDASEATWKQRRRKIEQWIAARPQSHVAKLALALHQVEMAFQAVGGEDSDNDGGRWDLFRERIKAARPTLNAIPVDSPLWFSVHARLNRMNFSELTDVAKEGMTKYRWYAPLFRQTLHAYLPRWNSEGAEWQDFAREVGQRYGAQHYAMLCLEGFSATGIKGLDPKRLDFPLLKKGLELRLSDEPNDDWARNAEALFAWKCGDHEAAQEAFAMIGQHPNPEFWQGFEKEFAEAKAWAGQPKTPEPSSALQRK